MSKLVICEKPSVAQSIGKVLGASKRCDGYLEGGGYLVSWCVGHLVELAQPEAYGETYAKWRLEDLPILPEKWRYQVSPATKKQFQILKELMGREDVASIVEATDAGREGELIFRLVYHQCKCKKPFERLWISSMEDAAIREGFARLRPGTEYDALYEAALCRERADWIVGINATRLFSCKYGPTLNVGRVMTPTLAMVCGREAAISGFQSEPFYTVQLVPEGFAANGERMKEKTEAEKVAEECRRAGTATVVKSERKDRTEKPPALYDLTSLQRDANRQLGYTAQQTLDYTQSLYEKKLVTYPRTDSRYLTEDMAGMLPGLVEMVQKKRDISPDALVPVNAAQVINGKKVSDHHAIIPTKTLESADLAELPSGELAVLDLIALRFVCAVGDPCRYSETAVTLECAGHQFKSKGKTVTDPGWRAYATAADGEKDGDDAPPIPTLSEDAELPLAKVELKEGKTTPPKRFTEDTLLQSMETAGAEEMPEDVERKGIGTPATRAAIIEKLVQKGFVERKGDKKAKALVPTDKGRALAAVVPEQIQSPSMTAEWEEKLLGIEKGGYAPDDFMREIAGMVTDLVKNYETVKGVEINMPGNSKVIGSCPHCGADVAERDKGWFCTHRVPTKSSDFVGEGGATERSGCSPQGGRSGVEFVTTQCRFVLWKDNAYFKKIGKHLTAGMAEKLVKEGRVKLKDCKSQRTGRTYNADVLLTTEEDGRAKFQMEFDNSGKKSGGKKN
jgi:DNA topoisomerase-3